MPVYHIKSVGSSTATVGSRKEVGREEGLAMIREAMAITDDPERVQEILKQRLGSLPGSV